MFIMKQPLVSVIVPTFNSAGTLGKCLRSIRNQTCGNVEAIVVDKFSTDGTREIAGKYDAKFFRSNLNKVQARNFGANQSKRKFLLHADADMELEKNVIEECVNASAGADAIYIPETAKCKGFFGRCRKLEKDIYVNDSNVEAARFVNRKVFEKLGGFDENFDGLDEYAFHAKLEKNKVRTARISPRIFVNEKISLCKDLNKKFYRGQELKEFEKKYPKDAKNRFSSARLSSYINHMDALLSQPLHSVGMLALKFLEISAFYAGSLFPERRTEKVKDVFDGESSRYEREMYLGTIGARFVDKVEKEAVLSQFPKSGKVLDLGVGPGRWSRELVRLGHAVTGVDISEKMLEVARNNIKSGRFKTVNSDMESLPFEDSEFDAVNCIRAVKYAKNYRNVFTSANRVLKRNGVFVLEVSNKSVLVAPLYYAAKLLKIFSLDRGIFSYLSHVKLFSKGEIRKELERSGFKVAGIKPIFIVPATLYSKIDSKLAFSLASSSERLLSRILPSSLFSRSFVITAKKK